jgi:hypothetical protein
LPANNVVEKPDIQPREGVSEVDNQETILTDKVGATENSGDEMDIKKQDGNTTKEFKETGTDKIDLEKSIDKENEITSVIPVNDIAADATEEIMILPLSALENIQPAVAEDVIPNPIPTEVDPTEMVGVEILPMPEHLMPPEPTRPPRVKLFKRQVEKNMKFSKHATHSCSAENFKIDLTNTESAQTKLLLGTSAGKGYEMEVGSLPDGIDIKFTRTQGYTRYPTHEDKSVRLDVSRQEGAQKGDFNVSILFTEFGEENATIACQLNIVNQ